MENFDSDWILEGLFKRKSQYSSVVVFETFDSMRYEQMVSFLVGSSEFSSHNLLEYSFWEGLFDLRRDKNILFEGELAVLEASVSSDSRIRDLWQALNYVDKIFSSGNNPTIFLIKNISERKNILIHALRSWSNSQKLRRLDSSVFVFTGDAREILDEYTLNQVSVVSTPISTEKEKEILLENASRAIRKKFDRGIVNAVSGLNLHQIKSSILYSIERKNSVDLEEIMKFKTEEIKKTGVLEVENPSLGFESIGGYEILKDFINRNIISVMRNTERAKKFGLSIPKGLLLFGPPGVGKTLAAKAFAKEVKLPFILLKTENIFGMYVGESEKRMKAAIKTAEEMSPSVLFVDEVDRFEKRTDISTDSGASRRVFSQLLEYLGNRNRKAVFVGTTNVPEFMDEGFIRPGRFDYKIPFFYPSTEARKSILSVQTNILRKVPLKDVNFEEISKKTEFYTGAEIEELVLRAARTAFNKEERKFVLQEDFNEAMSTFKIDSRIRENQLLRFLDSAKKFCDDQRFLSESIKEMNISPGGYV